MSSEEVRERKLFEKVRSAVTGEVGLMLNCCWPLSRLRDSPDVSRMPDEDRCIPCWADRDHLAK